jgi:hypothetical protein
MSIWTQLLFLHGYIATPRALAGILDAPESAAPTTEVPPGPPPSGPAALVVEVADLPRPPVFHHPLRVVGQVS